MKEIVRRCAISFCISSMCGLIVNLLIETIVRMVTGIDDFIPLLESYIGMFPSQSIALEVYILFYGVIGAAFAGFAFIYEISRIGFIIQNILYCISTGIVWIPIVIFVWHINDNIPSLIFTVICFVITYFIMSIVGYRITKDEVRQINKYLEES